MTKTEIKEKLYDDYDEQILQTISKKDMIIVMGDLNAIVKGSKQ